MSNEFIINNIETEEESRRYIIFHDPEALSELAKVLPNIAGIDIPKTREEAMLISASEEWQTNKTYVLPMIGAIVSTAPSEQISRLEIGKRSPIRQIRKEYIFQVASPAFRSSLVNVSSDYLDGYRAGVNSVVSELLKQEREELETEIQDNMIFADNSDFTWGLQASGANQSHHSGNGIRIALLDTGFDMNHPDFASREIVSRSFIEGVPTAQDDNGHGTHCLGTLCGPQRPVQGRRYGIAYNAELFVGKVMKSDGKGIERDILRGIEWALQNNCRIVSLSLGTAESVGTYPDEDYENMGAFALAHNCLIIAAAGNASARPERILPVQIPANSKTIMAIGAINRQLRLYVNSNGGVNPNGGGIDLVAPGVDVYSSKRLPPSPRYGNSNGTSMATPHVAGIAALMMEAAPNASAEQIWTRLTQSAKRLSLPSMDVGSGLVQAI